jgi:hypothetical protein
MSDVQADIAASQAVQAALSATSEAQSAVATVVDPSHGPADPATLVPGTLPVGNAEPAVEPQVTGAQVVASNGAEGTITVHVEHTGEPAVDHSIAAEGAKTEPVAKAKVNTGAALAEQRASFKVGGAQAGNAMDTMHGAVNSTWPPKAR